MSVTNTKLNEVLFRLEIPGFRIIGWTEPVFRLELT